MKRPTQDSNGAKRAASFLLKAIFSAGLVAVLIYKTETKGIVERLLAVNVVAMIVAAAVMAVFAVLPALRWRILLRLGGAEIPLSRLYQLLMIGNFLAQGVPSVGADGIRAWYVYRQGTSLSLASSVSSVLLDRLIALTSLLLLSLVSLPWLWKIVPSFIVWWMAALISLAAFGGLAVLYGFDWLPPTWGRYRIVWLANNLTGACRTLVRNPRALLHVAALSVGVQLLLSIYVYGLAGTLHVPVSLAGCVLLFPLVMLVATIPVSIAGWGMREGAMVVAFGFLDMPPSDAMLVSILFGIVVAVSTLPGLVFWLAMGRELKVEAGPHGS